MKKFVYLSILLFIFVLPINVNGKEAKCVYQTTAGQFTIEINSSLNISTKLICFGKDANGKYTVPKTCTRTLDSSEALRLYNVDNGSREASRSSFLDDNGKLYCPDWISWTYDYPETGMTNSENFAFSFKNKVNNEVQKTELSKELSKVINEDDPANPSPTYDNTCKYGPHTLYLNGKQIIPEFGDGYDSFRPIFSDFSYENFKNQGCPRKVCFACYYTQKECVIKAEEIDVSENKCYYNFSGGGSGADDWEKDPGFVYKPVSCDTFKDITTPIWTVIRILSPIIVLILGAVDFMKMTAAGDEKDMKKYLSTFIKRLIILVAIFLLPLIVNLFVGILGYQDVTACF